MQSNPQWWQCRSLVIANENVDKNFELWVEHLELAAWFIWGIGDHECEWNNLYAVDIMLHLRRYTTAMSFWIIFLCLKWSFKNSTHSVVASQVLHHLNGDVLRKLNLLNSRWTALISHPRGFVDDEDDIFRTASCVCIPWSNNKQDYKLFLMLGQAQSIMTQYNTVSWQLP